MESSSSSTRHHEQEPCKPKNACTKDTDDLASILHEDPYDVLDKVIRLIRDPSYNVNTKEQPSSAIDRARDGSTATRTRRDEKGGAGEEDNDLKVTLRQVKNLARQLGIPAHVVRDKISAVVRIVHHE